MTVLFMNSEHQPFPAQQPHNIKPTQIGMCFAGIIPEWRTIIVRWYLLGRESHFVLNVCLLVYFLYSSGCRMTICMWVALIRLREDFHFGGYLSLYTCMKFWTINKIYVKKIHLKDKVMQDNFKVLCSFPESKCWKLVNNDNSWPTQDHSWLLVPFW